MKKSLLVMCMTLSLSTVSMAQGMPNGSQHHGGPGRNPAVDNALKACASSLGLSQPGQGQRPSQADMSKMEACMSAKGFKRPSGPPPGGMGGHGGPGMQGGPDSSSTDSDDLSTNSNSSSN